MSWFRRTPHQRIVEKVQPVRNSTISEKTDKEKQKDGVSKTDSTRQNKDNKR